MATKCLTYDCYDRVYNSKHPLCTECYYDFQDGYLKECDDDDCKFFVDKAYGYCLGCKDKPKNTGKYKKEYNPNWKDDSEDNWVYILKLWKEDETKYNYYFGHTADLRARMGEHKDNEVKSTTGYNKELVYFNAYPKRDQARSMEATLREVNDNNPRNIRKMINEFRTILTGMKRQF